MREKERHGDARHAVRREPLGGEPEVRLELDAAPRELCHHVSCFGAHAALSKAQVEVAEAKPEQRLVVESLPAIAASLACPVQRMARRGSTACSMPQPRRPRRGVRAFVAFARAC